MKRKARRRFGKLRPRRVIGLIVSPGEKHHGRKGEIKDKISGKNR